MLLQCTYLIPQLLAPPVHFPPSVPLHQVHGKGHQLLLQVIHGIEVGDSEKQMWVPVCLPVFQHVPILICFEFSYFPLLALLTYINFSAIPNTKISIAFFIGCFCGTWRMIFLCSSNCPLPDFYCPN